jgi:Cu-Zn family superoxide dismutase
MKVLNGLALATLAALATGACMTDGAATAGAEQEGPEAGAALVGADGQSMAEAHVIQVRGLLRVELEAAGLRPGTYGAHIHAVGRCDPPGFESAGPHWNPGGRRHGSENPQGPHQGDLPNLEVDAEGRGLIIFAVENASLRGANPLLDADGAAVVIHAGTDDYRTDPSGNSGARIACGVLR